MPHLKSRFKEPFYSNYDQYETSENIGPGTGFYSNMHKYKSVKDFISSKRKKRKRKLAFIYVTSLLKVGIDFIADEYNPLKTDTMDGGTYQSAIPFGGMTDEYLMHEDDDGKGEWNLNHHRDMEQESNSKLTDAFLTPKEPEIYGLPDGILTEEKDSVNIPNNFYGIMNFINNDPRNDDSKNSTYSKIYI